MARTMLPTLFLVHALQAFAQAATEDTVKKVNTRFSDRVSGSVDSLHAQSSSDADKNYWMYKRALRPSMVYVTSNPTMTLEPAPDATETDSVRHEPRMVDAETLRYPFATLEPALYLPSRGLLSSSLEPSKATEIGPLCTDLSRCVVRAGEPSVADPIERRDSFQADIRPLSAEDLKALEDAIKIDPSSLEPRNTYVEPSKDEPVHVEQTNIRPIPRAKINSRERRLPEDRRRLAQNPVDTPTADFVGGVSYDPPPLEASGYGPVKIDGDGVPLLGNYGTKIALSEPAARNDHGVPSDDMDRKRSQLKADPLGGMDTVPGPGLGEKGAVKDEPRSVQAAEPYILDLEHDRPVNNPSTVDGPEPVEPARRRKRVKAKKPFKAIEFTPPSHLPKLHPVLNPETGRFNPESKAVHAAPSNNIDSGSLKPAVGASRTDTEMIGNIIRVELDPKMIAEVPKIKSIRTIKESR